MHEPLPGIEVQGHLAPFHRKLVDPLRLNPGDFKPSAVMVLLYQRSGLGWSFPLIQRFPYEGVHSAQVSLPGGKSNENDSGPEQTAKRECDEEIGVGKESETLGKLTPLFIPVSGFLVQPFVSFLPSEEPKFIPDSREVESVLEIPVKDLLNENNLRSGVVEVNRMKMETPYFDLAGKQVWGATAMILNELKTLLRPIF